MESDWIAYKCKSGQTMFIYNKVTGVHKWPPRLNNGSSEDSIMYGKPVEYKELNSIATQTDDYGCNNGCTSMYIDTDPHHVFNISETLPQPQQGDLGEGEHEWDNKCDPEDTLEDEDEQEQSQDMNQIGTMARALEEMEFPPGNKFVTKENETRDDYAGDDNAEKRLLGEIEECSSRHSEKFYKCSYCAKQLKNKSSLLVHVRIHTKEKPFECSLCTSKFARKGDFTRHLKIHTGEKSLACFYCKKKFEKQSKLNIHFRIHTGEKPYECSYCNKKFTQNSNLKCHLRIHTQEKPFGCTLCKKKFRHKCSLKTHITLEGCIPQENLESQG